jgi:hypothetical protein
MNVSTTQMDPRVAAIHYKDYRKAVRKHREERLEAARKAITTSGQDLRKARSMRTQIEKEDEALMLSYREMAKGQRVLNLTQVFRETGLDKNEKSRLPIIAVAQADWQHVWFKIDGSRAVFAKDSWPNWRHSYNKYDEGAIWVPANAFPAELTNYSWRANNQLPPAERQKALVPAIPAMLRPSGDLSKYHILWEAEWKHEAPTDPLLLKHVTGTIYTVLAQWDLTPIEKMVLEGRVNS